MKIKLWLKAFIPHRIKKLSGQELTVKTELIKNPTHEKESMATLIPLLTSFPYLASYATDQRDFSDNHEDSARVTTLIDIPDSSSSQIEVTRYCDPSFQVTTRWQLYPFKQYKNIESLTALPKGETHIERDDKTIHINFSTLASNPFFTFAGISYAPYVEIKCDIHLNFLANNQLEILLDASFNQFPAFEAYVQLEDYKPVELFQKRPYPGHTPFNLFYGTTKISVQLSSENDWSYKNSKVREIGIFKVCKKIASEVFPMSQQFLRASL